MAVFFFFNDTATTEIYTLSLHDALPISPEGGARGLVSGPVDARSPAARLLQGEKRALTSPRSEEHTSELQSPDHLVCRLLLEKKNPHQSARRAFPPPTRRPPHPHHPRPL